MRSLSLGPARAGAGRTAAGAVTSAFSEQSRQRRLRQPAGLFRARAVPMAPVPRLPDNTPDLSGSLARRGPIQDRAVGLAQGDDSASAGSQSSWRPDSWMTRKRTACRPACRGSRPIPEDRRTRRTRRRRASSSSSKEHSQLARQIFRGLWPEASRARGPDLVWAFSRPVGGRHAGDRHRSISMTGSGSIFGATHTEKLHTIERWTRRLWTLENRVTIDDPGVYARPLR